MNAHDWTVTVSIHGDSLVIDGPNDFAIVNYSCFSRFGVTSTDKAWERFTRSFLYIQNYCEARNRRCHVLYDYHTQRKHYLCFKVILQHALNSGTVWFRAEGLSEGSLVGIDKIPSLVSRFHLDGELELLSNNSRHHIGGWN